jgi:hypothetical protein
MNGYDKTDFAAQNLCLSGWADVLQAADITDPTALLERVDHLEISPLASKSM